MALLIAELILLPLNQCDPRDRGEENCVRGPTQCSDSTSAARKQVAAHRKARRPFGPHASFLNQGKQSALDHIDGEAAERGLLVLLVHIAPGILQRLDASIERDDVLAVTAKRQRC